MDVKLFDFDLPDAAIALRPARPRHAARLLHMTADGGVHHAPNMLALPQRLRAGDVLVMNDVRVLPARLFARAAGKTKVHEVLPMQAGASTCDALVRGARRLKAGETLQILCGEQESAYSAQVLHKNDDGTVRLHFSHDLSTIMHACGRTPLPPYILRHRADDAADVSDYQTPAARVEAAVAAPTAGLHFDDDVLAGLRAAGVSMATLTLAVGAGTFRPVGVENTDDHSMHAEHAILTDAVAQQLNAVHARGGRIIAVGTTVLRTLESAADDRGQLHAFDAPTDLFITPGYRFKCIDALVTNFHPPRSTPLMLAAAFVGLDPLLRAYAQALTQGYRWCSYGDACLLERA